MISSDHISLNLLRYRQKMLEQAEEEERLRKQDELDGAFYVLYLVAVDQKMFLIAIEVDKIYRNVKIDNEIEKNCTPTVSTLF